MNGGSKANTPVTQKPSEFKDKSLGGDEWRPVLCLASYRPAVFSGYKGSWDARASVRHPLMTHREETHLHSFISLITSKLLSVGYALSPLSAVLFFILLISLFCACSHVGLMQPYLFPFRTTGDPATCPAGANLTTLTTPTI